VNSKDGNKEERNLKNDDCFLKKRKKGRMENFRA